MRSRLDDFKRESLIPASKKSSIFSSSEKSVKQDEVAEFIQAEQASINASNDAITVALTDLKQSAQTLLTTINPQTEKKLILAIKKSSSSITAEIRSMRSHMKALRAKQDELQSLLPPQHIEIKGGAPKGAKRKTKLKLSTAMVEQRLEAICNVLKSSRATMISKINEFNTITTRIEEYEKRDIKKIVLSINPDLDDQRVNNFLDDVEENALAAEGGAGGAKFSETQIKMIREAKEKKKQLLEMDSNLNDIVTMLTEMDSIIEGGQEMLDDVEENMQVTRVKTELAHDEIDKAVRIKLASKRCKLICALLTAAALGGICYWIYKSVKG